jgi:hypothetical protein
MIKKKKILVIVIVLGVLLVVLVSLSVGSSSSVIELLKGFLAYVLKHWGIVTFLFSGIGVVVITVIFKKLRDRKIEKEKLELRKKEIKLKEDDVELKKREIALKEQEIAQTRDIEEQRRKDEREPAKELLKSRLNKFITHWEEDKESILERSQKREEELKNNLFEIGNELKKKVDEKENLLPQTIVEKAEDIAEGIINLSNKLRPAVETRRIQMQEYKEGEKLAERAKELIKEIEKL